MYKISIFLVICATQFCGNYGNVPGEAWVGRARVVDEVEYFTKVMQELVHEVEKRDWGSLKLTNVNQNIDTLIANWHVTGTVNYTNGFVISIQKIDLSTISSVITTVIQDNVLIPSASVGGTLHFRHMNLGYDVIANLTDIGVQKYTGSLLTNNVAFGYTITKNLITQNITASGGLTAVEGANIRMIYRPENHLTQVLSRNFAAYHNWDGLSTWSQPFLTILTDIVHNKIDFPRVCFNDCS